MHALPAKGLAVITSDHVTAWDEIHHSQQPMRQQFRFASEGPSRSGRLLADRSPVGKHELCRFGGKVMSRTAVSDGGCFSKVLGIPGPGLLVRGALVLGPRSRPS